jgi:hypothetical protein
MIAINQFILDNNNSIHFLFINGQTADRRTEKFTRISRKENQESYKRNTKSNNLSNDNR